MAWQALLSGAVSMFTGGKNLALLGTGALAAGSLTFAYFQYQWRLEDIASYEKQLSQAETNVANLEAQNQEIQINFNAYKARKQAEEEANRLFVLKTQALRDSLEKEQARSNKRRKQYEKVYVERPDLAAGAYDRFYPRKLRKYEAASCGARCNSNEDGN